MAGAVRAPRRESGATAAAGGSTAGVRVDPRARLRPRDDRLGWAIATYEVTLSERPTGPQDDAPAWTRTVEAASRPEAVRLAEEQFRDETGREPLYVAVRALA